MTGASITRAPPGLLDEIVIEILIRLPVKSLVRFKSVSRTWRALISSEFFIRAHLEQSSSASSKQRGPSFLVTLHALPHPGETQPTPFSTHFRFYQWRPGGTGGDDIANNKQAAAPLVYETDLVGNQYSRLRRFFAHCDGLVLAPTDAKLYLFNPATRDAVALPNNDGILPLQRGGYFPYAAGLGLDPKTGKYKVVRLFYRWLDYSNRTYRLGMEVFTVGEESGGGAWREMATDPPYSVDPWQTAVTVKGFMFWHMDRTRGDRGLLRLGLADEKFRVVELPDALDPAADMMLDAVHGDELCLTDRRTGVDPAYGTVTMWVMSSRDGYSRWERRYTIQASDVCHPMGLVPHDDGGGGLVSLRRGYELYRYDWESTEELNVECRMDRMRYQERRARTWKNMFRLNVKPYTESLVPVTV
ncbi:hypothetical protein PR202_gb06525 [Eleusine coracana subsp. coracana]|uniref:F-box domain-containing protein n=1 Tax=Eleusine coracana subsp. coracana TaxID=191504 RepID=A0AAV5E834_ELECO|nr:hypothetical protein PR202_gb06525 [Eleusine coracana subsp. coracana]